MFLILRRLTIILTLFTLLVTVTPTPTPIAAQTDPPCTLDQLPRPGTGTLPPGEPAISGYVILNQQPISDATIVVTAANGVSQSVPLLRNPSLCAPFYELALGTAPLQLAAGQSVRFDVVVSGFATTIEHTIPTGGGRLDLQYATTAGCTSESALAQQQRTSADLFFEPNLGQADPAARFLTRTPAGVVFMTSTGLVIQGGTADTPQLAQIDFVAAQTPVLRGYAAQPAQTHYIGPDAQTLRPTAYAGVEYQTLYPGIDLRYDGQDRHLKGTYTVAPGVDPSLIRWHYANASVGLDPASGDLIASFANGLILREAAPIAWQESATGTEPVPVQFALHADGNVGFALGAYDPQQPLIIDPTLMWSTFIGGNDHDRAWEVAVDAQCNVYIMGTTLSIDFPIHNAYRATLEGTDDLFITRLSPDGSTIMFSTYLGGSGSEGPTQEAMGLALGPDGSVYVAGTTQSPDFPTTEGAFDRTFAADTCTSGPTPAPCYDAFLLKLTPEGSLAYSTLLGGTGNDHALALTVDANGQAYVAGYTSSRDFPVTDRAIQEIYRGIPGAEGDGFVATFNPQGSAIGYATYLGGAYSDAIFGIVVDAGGNAYVTGDTYSPDFPLTTTSFDTSFGGRSDAFVAKINPSGRSLTYASYLGGSQYDYGRGIALGPDGSAYLTGYAFSSDFPTTTGSADPSYNGDSNHTTADGFVVKVNPQGTSRAYSTFLGGARNDVGWSIAVDGDGTAIITGNTASDDFPLTADAADRLCGAEDSPCAVSVPDAFLVAIQPNGADLSYSTFLGGEDKDWGSAVVIDGAGSVYVAGLTASRSFPGTTPTVADPQKNGGDDAFVTRFDLTGLTAGSTIPTPGAWTLMFYLAGDNDLADYFKDQHRRLEQAAAQAGINIVILSDGPDQGDTIRYHVQADGSSIEGESRWALGELNLGEAATLRDFVRWSMATYPAQHYYLNLADHGRGTTGIAWDEQINSNEMLTVSELRSALMQATNNGANRLDVVHLDACLMGMFEVAADASAYADYLIASQNIAWSVFAFDRYAADATATTTPLELSRAVTLAYHDELNQRGTYPHTIAAVDLSRMDALSAALDNLVSLLLLSENTADVTAARAASQLFDSRTFNQLDPTDEYIDLADFAQNLSTISADPAIKASATALRERVSEAIVSDTNRVKSGSVRSRSGVHYWNLDRSNGLSLYFPPDIDSGDLHFYLRNGLFWYTQYGSWDDYLRTYFELGSLVALPPVQSQPVERPPVPSAHYSVYLPHVRR